MKSRVPIRNDKCFVAKETGTKTGHELSSLIELGGLQTAKKSKNNREKAQKPRHKQPPEGGLWHRCTATRLRCYLVTYLFQVSRIAIKSVPGVDDCDRRYLILSRLVHVNHYFF